MPGLQTAVPRLLPGQELTREEFLFRWEAMPELKNAELIDGIVYMASPLSDPHSILDGLIQGLLFTYRAETPGCVSGSNGTWLMLESAPQPDSHLRILPEHGGQSRLEGEYPAGAPELIVEVCASSRTHDFGPKLALYRRAKVREYVTVTIKPPQVIWRELMDLKYVEMEPTADGVFRSKTFPGLWLSAEALLAGDVTRLLKVLRKGLASPEHAAFVKKLQAWGSH